MSNEALAETRDAELLAYLIGDARVAVFDESVHGLSENRNVAWLLHRYHLNMLVGAVAFLLLLTLWQQTCPLLPRQHEAPGAVQRVAEKGGGIESLLHRYLRGAELPQKIAEVWLQSDPPPEAAVRQALLEEVERAKTAKPPPLETCRALYGIIQKQTRKGITK